MLTSLDPERSGRRPSRFDVGEVERIELRPQDVALVTQGLYRQPLFDASVRIVVNVVHRELRILWSLIESGLEVIQPSCQPRVMLAQFFHAQGNQLGRKQFCQGGGDRFQQSPAANNIQVFIDCETSCGKNAVAGADLCRIKTSRLRQFYPALDAALAGGVSVVVDHAFAPRSAEDRVRAAREDDRIFDGDDALIVVAVQRPGLQLSAAEFAFVHQPMKRMLVMVAFLACSLKLRAQLVERKQASGLRCGLGSYRSNCHPSSATSQPAFRTRRYSALASSSMGLVLLMCRNILRGRRSPAKLIRVLSTGTWPIWSAVCPLPCTRISSSSLQKVPSKSRMSQELSCWRRASSRLGTAGM